jgi:hypothetical protein
MTRLAVSGGIVDECVGSPPLIGGFASKNTHGIFRTSGDKQPETVENAAPGNTQGLLGHVFELQCLGKGAGFGSYRRLYIIDYSCRSAYPLTGPQ